MGKYRLGDWVIDPSQSLLINNDEIIKIEPKCMDLLMLLINANGNLVSRKAIMESLWQGRYVSDHAVNNVVAMLRKYLHNGSDINFITTQPKRGYILSVPAFEMGETLEEVAQDTEHSKAKSTHRKIGKKSVLSIIAATFVVSVIVLMVVFQATNEEHGSIVVLPFDAIDSDETSIIFAKGLSEEINHQLSSTTRLNIIAHSLMKSAEQQQVSNQSIARQLSAKYFLEGSVRAEQNVLRITTRLVNRTTGNQLWSEVYTANKNDMLSSQYSVGRLLTKKISASLETTSMLNNSKGNISTNAGALTPNASEFFLNLVNKPNPSQFITNEWQIGMYDSSIFILFDYSPTTVLGRTSIVGWVNRGFHAGFLNKSEKDEIFPGNVFKAGTLNLHPGNDSAEVVLRYLVQQDGNYDISGHFLATDSIECLKCTSDGVNVLVRVNGYPLNDSRHLTGFGKTTTYHVTGSDIALKRGDIVDFIVMPRSTFFDDATIVTASVARKDQ